MKKTKLVVFDMEGVIFRSRINFCLNGQDYVGGIWTLLCDILGTGASKKNMENYERFKHRHDPKYKDEPYYGYFRFVEDTIDIFKNYGADETKKGLSRAQFEDVIKSVPYFPGVAETFAKLKEHGIRIALISGGLKALADRVIWDYGIDSSYTAAELFWEGETLHRWNINPTDFEHKKTLIESLHRDLGIKHKEIMFVGDGDNDQHIADYCGVAIAFNPTGTKLNDYCSAVVNVEDLSAVLPFVHL
jgi:phosphoserine phosphatase